MILMSLERKKEKNQSASCSYVVPTRSNTHDSSWTPRTHMIPFVLLSLQGLRVPGVPGWNCKKADSRAETRKKPSFCYIIYTGAIYNLFSARLGQD